MERWCDQHVPFLMPFFGGQGRSRVRVWVGPQKMANRSRLIHCMSRAGIFFRRPSHAAPRFIKIMGSADQRFFGRDEKHDSWRFPAYEVSGKLGKDPMANSATRTQPVEHPTNRSHADPHRIPNTDRTSSKEGKEPQQSTALSIHQSFTDLPQPTTSFAFSSLRATSTTSEPAPSPPGRRHTVSGTYDIIM